MRTLPFLFEAFMVPLQWGGGAKKKTAADMLAEAKAQSRATTPAYVNSEGEVDDGHGGGGSRPGTGASDADMSEFEKTEAKRKRKALLAPHLVKQERPDWWDEKVSLKMEVFSQESDGNDKFLGQVSLFTHDMGSLPKYYDPMTLQAHGEDRLTKPYVRVRTGKDNAVRTDTRIEKYSADGNR
jgi:hypothetical protein